MDKTIHQRENVFAKRENLRIFQSKNIFDTDFIPEVIIERPDFQMVIDFFDNCLRYELQGNLIIIGPSGSGKTLSVRFYGQEAERYAKDKGIDFKLIYLNCREIMSPYFFYQALLRQFGEKVPKGYGTSELVEMFINHIRDSRHVVLVLDEFDKLYSTSQEKANDIVYMLSRIKSNRDLGVAISTIMISNNVHLSENFDTPVQSSLNSKILHLGAYNAEELYHILHSRAKIGLLESAYEEGLLRYCSALTAKNSEDARFNIRLLFNAGELAEKDGEDKITETHIKNSINLTKRETETDAIERLSLNQLIVLYSLVNFKRRNNIKLIPVKTTYCEAYKLICKQVGYEEITYPHFWRLVNSLGQYDLVYSLLQTPKQGGFRRVVELNVDEEAVEKIFKIKIA